MDNIENEIHDMLFKNLQSKSEDFNVKQGKLIEYKITPDMLKKAYFVMLDGIICKDRLNLTKESKDNPKVNMADLNFIIGINGHLLYTVKPEVARAEKPAMRLQKNKQYRM